MESKIDLERYFINRLDCSTNNAELAEKLREYADIWMEILQEQIQCERDFTGNVGLKLNSTVYNGAAGLALLDIFLAEKYEMPEADRELLVMRAGTLLDYSLKKLKGRKHSFLGGDSGTLALTICMYYDMIKKGCPVEHMVCIYKDKLLTFLPLALQPCPDEDAAGVLCGNAGYLWALLYVTQRCPGVIPREALQQVVIALVNCGMPCPNSRRDYLLWKWRGRHVLGAPHGVFGILYVLLKAVSYWPISDDDLDEGLISRRRGSNSVDLSDLLVEEKHEIMAGMFCMLDYDLPGCEKRPRLTLVKWIFNTLNFLATQIFASGNTLPALGYSEDLYVNWAFGAPGSIYTFIEAHKIFRTPLFLNAAIKAAETIWHRGLVKDGYGLADGVAGNAYALMAMYKYTKEEKYKNQALAFAEYCCNYSLNDERCCAEPIYPLSLYEGLPGVVYMLYDFAKGDNPKFPGFEL